MKKIFSAAVLLGCMSLPSPGFAEDGLGLCVTSCFSKQEGDAKVNLQTIIVNRKAEPYGPGERLNKYYVDIKINCNSDGLQKLAQQFVDRAWNIGVLSSDRDWALTLDVEKITAASAAKPSPVIATYLIGQLKRDASGTTSVSHCDDYVATNLPFGVEYRLKFKLLQSKTTNIRPAAYSAFRLFSKVVGFLVGGPSGVAVAATVSTISTKVEESKSDIEQLTKMFDEVNTQSPQMALDSMDKKVTFTLPGSARLEIEKRAKRSAFLDFDANKVQNPGGNLQKTIEDKTGIDLDKYLSTDAGGWRDLFKSAAANTAGTGCDKVRTSANFSPRKSASSLSPS